MEVVAQNPTVLNFLLGFHKEDWAECVTLTALLGIKSLNGARPSIAQLRTIGNAPPASPASRKPRLMPKYSQHSPRASYKLRTPKPSPSTSRRVVPRHLRKVSSKIRMQVRQDRELFRSLSKEHMKSEYSMGQQDFAPQSPLFAKGSAKRSARVSARLPVKKSTKETPKARDSAKPSARVSEKNTLQPTARRWNEKPPHVLDTQNNESFEALLNALTPSKPEPPRVLKPVSASALITLDGAALSDSSSSLNS